MIDNNILQHFQPEEELFIEQVRDWQQQVVSQYVPVLTPFLNPRQQRILQQVIGKTSDCRIAFGGGFSHAESQRALLHPEYFTVQAEDFAIVTFQLHFAKKFHQLSHRQILGTIISLGISRNRIGDIITEDGEWQFVIDESLADFLPLQLTHIGKVSVELERVNAPTQLFAAQKNWQSKEASISSLRLDVFVSEGLNISRQKAKHIIETGDVKRNWLKITQPNQMLEMGDIISIRHYGRLRFDGILTETKKGKLRIQLSILRNK